MQGEVFCTPLLKAKKIEEAFRLPDFFQLRHPCQCRGKPIDWQWLVFVEFPIHQLLKLIQSLTSILTGRLDQNVTAFTGCQHH